MLTVRDLDKIKQIIRKQYSHQVFFMILYKIHINLFHQVIPVNLAKEALSCIMRCFRLHASNYSSFDSFFPIARPSKSFSFAPKSIAWRFPRSPDRRRREERIPITQTLNRREKKKGS